MDLDLSSPSHPPAQPSSFTAADRVAELNQIDQSISTLLAAASDAIGILSNSPGPENQEHALRNSSRARSTFTESTSIYFSTLSSIEVRLRRQVYALEEADLIKAGDDRDTRRGRTLGGDGSGAKVGGGPLDPSWLNARASDSVEAKKKRELISRARDFVEKVVDKEDSTMNGDKPKDEAAGGAQDEDEDMG